VTNTTAVTVNNVRDVLDEIHEAFYDIPFENSAFQTEAFVIAAAITPERAYRQIGLQMITKLQSMLAFREQEEIAQIDMDEQQSIINDPATSEFDRRRAQVKLRNMRLNDKYKHKLINDGVQELNLLYSHLKRYPKYTREQFESAEREHYERRLVRQVQGATGALEAIVNMREDMKALDEYTDKIKALGGEVSSDTLLALLNEMPNRLEEPKR
jgi:hypothetical protein